MANYYCTARTNYFRVRDEKEFRAFAKKHGFEVIEDDDGRFGLLPDSMSDCGNFQIVPDENNEDVDDECFEFMLSHHLAHGSIAIVMEAGAEKHRYVHGHAIAIDCHGDTVQLTLRDIYDAIQEHWGREISDNVTACEY